MARFRRPYPAGPRCRTTGRRLRGGSAWAAWLAAPGYGSQALIVFAFFAPAASLPLSGGRVRRSIARRRCRSGLATLSLSRWWQSLSEASLPGVMVPPALELVSIVRKAQEMASLQELADSQANSLGAFAFSVSADASPAASMRHQNRHYRPHLATCASCVP